MMFSRHHSRRRGFTLVEAMMVLVTLSIVGVAAGIGLQSVSGSPGQIEQRLWNSQQIASTIENLRDTPYASLTSGSKTSDANYKGVTGTITWTVLEIDPAFATSSTPVAKANSGLKQVTVSFNNQSAVTWVAQ